MSTTDSASPTDVAPATTVNRPLLAVAATASAGAGLVHAAAAGTHAGDRSLILLFSITAAVQVAWAAAAAVRPGRITALAGIGLNLAGVVAWVLSRTVGLPLIDSLGEVEAVGTQDLVAAALATVAVLGAGLALVPPIARRRPSLAWSGLAGVALLALAVPGMAAEHTHGPSHEHDHGTEIATSDGHDHPSDDTGDGSATAAGGTTGSGGHDHGPMPARLDHEPTEAQQDDARELVAATTEAVARYTSVDDAVAAGYVSIGDGRRVGGYEHFINHAYLANDTILDPDEPESLVFRHNEDGTKQLTTAMYILPPGSTMDDVPDIAGNLTMWHGHDNLCFDPATGRLSGRFDGTNCVPGGVQGGNVPMLHVWIEPNECGPFAGTDNKGMTGACVKDF